MRAIYFILKVDAKIADVEFKGKSNIQTGVSENNLNGNKRQSNKNINFVINAHPGLSH